MENHDAQDIATATAEKLFAEKAKAEAEAKAKPAIETKDEAQITATTAPIETTPPPAEAPTVPPLTTETSQPKTTPEPEPNVNHPTSFRLKSKSRFSLTSRIIGGIVGLAVTILTFNARTKNSRVSAAESLYPTIDSKNNPLGAITNLYQKAQGLAPDEDLDKALNKAKASAAKLGKNTAKSSGLWQSNMSKNIKNFVDAPKYSKTKPAAKGGNNGLIPLAAKFIGGITWLGVKTTQFVAKKGVTAADIALIKGTSKAGARKIDERAEAKAEKITNRFKREAYNSIGKNSDTVKVGFGAHAKNGAISVGLGATVGLLTTMGVQKFLDIFESRRADKSRAEQVKMDRQIAMIQPQTQMSVQ